MFCRKNPQHFKEECHPPTHPNALQHMVKWVPSGVSKCKYGMSCYRKHRQHFADEAHPAAHPMAVRGDNDKDGDEDMQAGSSSIGASGGAGGRAGGGGGGWRGKRRIGADDDDDDEKEEEKEEDEGEERAKQQKRDDFAVVAVERKHEVKDSGMEEKERKEKEEKEQKQKDNDKDKDKGKDNHKKKEKVEEKNRESQESRARQAPEVEDFNGKQPDRRQEVVRSVHNSEEEAGAWEKEREEEVERRKMVEAKVGIEVQSVRKKREAEAEAEEDGITKAEEEEERKRLQIVREQVKEKFNKLADLEREAAHVHKDKIAKISAAAQRDGLNETVVEAQRDSKEVSEMGALICEPIVQDKAHPGQDMAAEDSRPITVVKASGQDSAQDVEVPPPIVPLKIRIPSDLVADFVSDWDAAQALVMPLLGADPFLGCDLDVAARYATSTLLRRDYGQRNDPSTLL